MLEQDKDDEYIDPVGKKGRIDHSTAGAQTIWQEVSKHGQLAQIVGQIMALCVASHHSGLIDCIGVDGTDQFSKRMNKPDALSHRDEVESRADQVVGSRYKELLREGSLMPAFGSIIKAICKHDKNENIVRFKVGLLARYLFSCLIDADRVNTADFEEPKAVEAGRGLQTADRGLFPAGTTQGFRSAA